MREHYSFLALAATTACIKSRWLLESVNSSTRPTFRLPSSSVTMWSIMIDSRIPSTPVAVFNLVEICGVGPRRGVKPSRCSVDLDNSNTYVNDDLPRSVYDRMDGCLREEFNRVNWVRAVANAAYRILSQKAENTREVFKPLLSV